VRVIRNWLVRGSLVAASVAAMTAASLTPTLSRASAQDGGDPPPTPTAQTRFVYASSSSGDDANEGLSPMEPKQSLAAAAGLLRSNSSDWLLLKRGDEWNEGLAGLIPNGASEQTPIVITAYGDGADPRVMPGDASTARPGSNNTRSYGVEFAEDAPPPPPTGDAPTLTPGDGWTGPTEQPPAVGNPGDPGYDAKAIARWDVVPYQTFDGVFEIGVVAFHMNGIDRVEFSVEGGPWVAVEEMTLNPRTDVVEYWAKLDASLFAEDGPIEVRAIAWPEVGEPRVLAGHNMSVGNGEYSLPLNANAGGTFGAGEVYVDAVHGDDATADGSQANPFRTIYAAMKVNGAVNIDGLDVLLQPGTYLFDGRAHPRPTTQHAWLTIRPAPGVERSEVLLTSGRFRVKQVAAHNVTLDLTDGGEIGKFSQLDPHLWLHDVVALGPGLAEGTTVARSSGFVGLYYTDTSISDFQDAARGTNICRNVNVATIGADAFTDSRLVVNCSASGIGHSPPGSGIHADVYQFSGGTTRDNTIVYGMTATDVNAQGIFMADLDRIDNSAFVNILIDAVTHKSQWRNSDGNHFLLWHVAVRGQPFNWDPGVLENLSVVGSIWEKVEGADISSISPGFDHNHFVDSSSFSAQVYGSDATTGPIAPGGGILQSRVTNRVAEVDIENQPREIPAALGPHEDGILPGVD